MQLFMDSRSPRATRHSGALAGLLLACLFMAACGAEAEVPYSDLTAPPSVIIEGGTVVIRLAALRESPPTYVMPAVHFDDEGIKITGAVVYTKAAKTRVKIPDAYRDRRSWKAFWIDPDGSRKLLTIGLEPE